MKYADINCMIFILLDLFSPQRYCQLKKPKLILQFPSGWWKSISLSSSDSLAKEKPTKRNASFQ